MKTFSWPRYVIGGVLMTALYVVTALPAATLLHLLDRRAARKRRAEQMHGVYLARISRGALKPGYWQ